MEISRAAARAVIKRLKSGQSSVGAEAKKLGCGWRNFHAELRHVLGWEEFDRLMFRELPVIGDPRRCPRDGAWLTLGTINGLGAFMCGCGFCEVIVPRRPTHAERTRPEPNSER